MNEFDDEQLIERCKNGQQDAFEHLIRKYHVPLYNYVYSLVSDKLSAEDIVQETFISMINNIEKYKSRDNTKFSTWLFTIARNKVTDDFRKRKIKESEYIEESIDYFHCKNNYFFL